jgi:hypothetical protein
MIEQAKQQILDRVKRDLREVLQEALSPNSREVAALIQLCSSIDSQIRSLELVDLKESLSRLEATCKHFHSKLEDLPKAEDVREALVTMGELYVRIGKRAVAELR